MIINLYVNIHTYMPRTPKYMLNPFKIRSPTETIEWSKIYSDTGRPLLLDVGCARGKWIYNLAKENTVRLELDGKQYNYCGLELVCVYECFCVCMYVCMHVCNYVESCKGKYCAT